MCLFCLLFRRQESLSFVDAEVLPAFELLPVSWRQLCDADLRQKLRVLRNKQTLRIKRFHPFCVPYQRHKTNDSLQPFLELELVLFVSHTWKTPEKPDPLAHDYITMLVTLYLAFYTYELREASVAPDGGWRFVTMQSCRVVVVLHLEKRLQVLVSGMTMSHFRKKSVAQIALMTCKSYLIVDSSRFRV